MTIIRCKSCRGFFEKRQPACPRCGTQKTPLNSALEAQRWATNLNNSAQRAIETG